MAERAQHHSVHFWTNGLHATLCKTDEDSFDWSDLAGDVTCYVCLKRLEELTQGRRAREGWDDEIGLGRQP